MNGKYPKSKLKRKRSCVETLRSEIYSKDTVKSGRLATAVSADITEDTAEWWKGEQLPAVESLWAFTLTSALPYLQNQHGAVVPDLPPPSTARPPAQKLDELHWCDLREEVAPFPEPAPPSQGTLIPYPLRLRSSQQPLLIQTEPVPHTSKTTQNQDGKTASLQALAKRSWMSFHRWEEGVSSSGCPSVSGEEGRKGGEQEEDARPVNRQLLTKQVKLSGIQLVSLQENESKEEVVKEEEEEDQASVRGDGGDRLKSCPMCLLLFPVGFTQLDCDGHLAQCLSEMNVDMTW